MLFLLLAALTQTAVVKGQSAHAPLDNDYYRLLQRYELKQGRFSGSFHAAVKPYQRQHIAAFIDSIKKDNLNDRDHFNLFYLANDNWEYMDSVDNESRNPVFNRFYRVRSDLFHVRTNDFDLHLNPVLHLSTGRESGISDRLFQNTRGLEVRGMIGNKVGFYSFVGENQAAFPSFVRQWNRENKVIPGEGFWKRFKENGVDFFTARGYISFNIIKEINAQFGYDKMFIGDGYRSMILSDFPNSYLFLKLNTKVWRLNYTNLFTKLTAEALGSSTGSSGVHRYPSKYMNLHHLSLNITDHFNIGLFEAVVFGTPDSAGVQHYEVSYLNPIIFYRAMEHQSGSIDNAIVGADFRWIIARNYLLYGQLVLDEFLLKEVKEKTGWWANKYGLQLGFRNADFLGIPNLDLQLERNEARPYTYGHSDIYTNYAHYNQPLAHPLGANFREYVGLIRYQPLNRLWLEAKAIKMTYGADTAGSNWGKNIMLPYTTREQDYGNELAQGVSTDVFSVGFRASFQVKHNLFIDLNQNIRDFKNAINIQDRTSFTQIGLRWNSPGRAFDF